jgi:Delta7-sterol 5-desaturase
MRQALEYIIATLGITLYTAVRYFVFAGIAWLIGYVWFKRRWFYRKIVMRFPESADVRREMFHSTKTLFIFGIVGAITHFGLIKNGYSQMYFKIDQHGWGWYAASVALAILIHDTYFYFTHRIMHHPKLFKYFHSTHHLSHNPTPWASYAFSVPEGVVQAGIFPVVALLVPIHPTAFILFMTWQITFNVIGHTGYEFYPRWLMDSWLGKILNTPTNHAQHHETFRGNYGLYFNVWDRVLGTNHADYEKRFREVTSRVPQPHQQETAV